MTLLSIAKVQKKTKLVDQYNVCCDECNKEFVITISKLGQKPLHFCSKECSKKSSQAGGKLHAQVNATKKKNNPEMFDVVELDEATGKWKRKCPVCHEILLIKNKNKALDGKRNNKPCTKCNRSLSGKKNARTDMCPICDKTFVVSHGNQSDAEKHATLHNISLEELYCIKHNLQQPTTCKCGCGTQVKWNGWWRGYDTFVFGHQSKLAKKGNRGKNWRESNVWRGKTKETDERVAKRAISTSISRKKAFDEGCIKIWSKGLSTKTDARIAKNALNLKEKWQKGEITNRLKGKTKENDATLRKISEKLKITCNDKKLRKKLDDKKKFSIERIVAMLGSRGILEYVSGYDCYKNGGSLITVHCKKCDQTYNEQLYKMFTGICRKCMQTSSVSADQHEINEYVKSLGINTILCDRSVLHPLEIDIYIPEKKFGIEFNGLYWHSSLHKDNAYHQNKTQSAHNAGIKLMHVFEDEWNDKRDIVKSMIAVKLGIFSSRFGARQCKIVEVDSKTRKKFFIENHIDGDVSNVNVAYGLLSPNDELVAVMSLRKPRQAKYNGKYEVARFACRINTNVIGALSKLSKHAATHVKSALMSYVDTRLNSSPIWESSNWKLVGETVPRFWWADLEHCQRIDRFKIKADKSRGLTEKQVAEEAGVVKIYGCKNLVYEFNIT